MDEREQHLIRVMMNLIHAGLASRVLLLTNSPDQDEYDTATRTMMEYAGLGRIGWIRFDNERTLAYNRGSKVLVRPWDVTIDKLRGLMFDLIVPLPKDYIVRHDLRLLMRGTCPLEVTGL